MGRISAKGGGMVIPSAFAVFRLTARPNLAGCSIGRSAGIAPCNILAAVVDHRRGSENPLQLRSLKSLRLNALMTCRYENQHIGNAFGILDMTSCKIGTACDAIVQIDEQSSETSPKEIGEEGHKKQARPSAATPWTGLGWRLGESPFGAYAERNRVTPGWTDATGGDDLPSGS